jgi:hypothetical protein
MDALKALWIELSNLQWTQEDTLMIVITTCLWVTVFVIIALFDNKYKFKKQ